jgi:hypothetical protein
VNRSSYPLQQLIDEYQAGGITEDELRSRAALLPERTINVNVVVTVRLSKVISLPVDLLTEAGIDESGDVYNDAVTAQIPGFDGWDKIDVQDEDHFWVEKEKS